MNIDQMKKILADAPARALSVDADCNWYYLSESRSLSDLRTILEQHEEIERLRKTVSSLENLTGWHITNISFTSKAMSDAEIVELSKLDKEKDNE